MPDYGPRSPSRTHPPQNNRPPREHGRKMGSRGRGLWLPPCLSSVWFPRLVICRVCVWRPSLPVQSSGSRLHRKPLPRDTMCTERPSPRLDVPGAGTRCDREAGSGRRDCWNRPPDSPWPQKLSRWQRALRLSQVTFHQRVCKGSSQDAASALPSEPETRVS